MSAGSPIERMVEPEHAGCRLDVFLASQFPEFSRAQLRRAIDAGAVSLNDRPAKAGQRLKGGEQLRFALPELPRPGPVPEDIPLQILFEDEHLAAINKPPGMVVHPAKGHWSGTLAAALAFHFQQLSGAGGPTRPGIVHRLDRDTSGVLVVAKTDAAHYALAEQFAQRTVQKEYFAIVVGAIDRDRDVIDMPIGMHPYQREKMAIRRDHPSSRPAQTMYEVAELFDGFAALQVKPKTGRTHQIRVHLAAIGCPVLCDKQYGGRAEITRGEIRKQTDDRQVILARQALHAQRLSLAHPASGAVLTFEAPLAADLLAVLNELRSFRPPSKRTS
ncbi:MAG TPA: RluA family pseudouridine synthase [Pirellulales bacterium]|jgi:23S rRNA pseudouridine1911/1915/1917 synthase|nr:RluA family pseudouridine synthase [Pirellulales bacterium]